MKAARAISVAAALGAAPGWALTPIPPCEGVVESGMGLGDPWILGGGDSGYVVESYFNHSVPDADGTYLRVPVPVPALEGFSGTRVTECRSGRFLILPWEQPRDVAHALGATEFLRGDLQAGRAPSFPAVKQAAQAIYGPVTELRETEETCGCNSLFPELRPAGMPGFRERADQQGAAP